MRRHEEPVEYPGPANAGVFMNRQLLVTSWLFRLIGLSAILAIFAVAMPFSWMRGIHEYLGLGEMPEGPIVEYLARSLSALYALVGFVFWYVSYRVEENLGFVRLLGALFLVFGIVLLGIGVKSAMPMAWILLEGPPAILLGIWVVYNCRGGPAADAGKKKSG